MISNKVAVDRDVDQLYGELRNRYGSNNPRANGYLYEGYFRREQSLLFPLLNSEADVLVDVACGSGLMIQPLIDKRTQVIGIDFNADACSAARRNGLTVIRGDAFSLPLANASIDEIISCQFFNQQQASAVQHFIAETARVLRPGGRVIMVWRNGTSLIHRLALLCLGLVGKLRRVPSFPHENHHHGSIRSYAEKAGLTVVSQAVSFPPSGWMSPAIDSVLAHIIGTSNICVLEKFSE